VSSAEAYFSGLGFKKPAEVSLPEHLLSLVSPNSEASPEASAAFEQRLSQFYAAASSHRQKMMSLLRALR